MELHSAADSFVAEPAYDLEVVQMSTTPRRVLRGFGLLLSVVLPGLSLHFDPYGFDVTCDSGEQTLAIDVVRQWASRVQPLLRRAV
ncbi:MAG: hypothetical protein GY822_29885 [Deltaproteobacteria bacterium]|nr:hypothetical protein [Deltaproteobacteria bacterium]